ncbi:calcium-binding protein [Maridesulfovibrio zosterae]|uniref:calcium-binding protein n=1 Tax=Maridesulfovibrio zosterae TaxID=82171 RepID=UPI000429DEBD|nr:calcium-binding protein [Maridesulfovibrio zosterae]
MKKVFGCSMVVLALTLMCSLAIAADYPEIRGTWVGKVRMIKSDGSIITSKSAMVINKQDGELFSGYKAWFAENKDNLITENFKGIIGADGKSLYLAEAGEGYTQGFITGKQSMSLYYLEDGRKCKAISYSMERIHFSRAFIDIDKDGNKTVIRSEIVRVYPLNAERIMKEADLNKDGKLSKQEWEAWKKNK